MKRFLNKALAFLALGVILGACDKYEIDDHAEPVTSGAKVKFYHNSQDSPMLNYYFNGQQITAAAPVTTTNLQRGIAYNTTGLNAVYPVVGYANVEAGTYAAKVIVPAGSGTTTPAPNTELVSAAKEIKLDNGANYSIFAINKLASVETLVLKDEFAPADANKAQVRFVNTMVGAPTNYDLVYVRTDVTPNVTVTVGSNIGFKGFTGFVDLAPGSYSWYIFPAGTTSAYTSGSVTLTTGRVYTHLTRGNHVATVTSSTPVVSITANR